MTEANSIDIRIYYEDTDSGGVVYYANYLKYCERGRTEFLRNLGFKQQELMQQNVVFVVRKATVDYKLPARLDDEITVVTDIERIKRVSIIFKQTIKRKNDTLCQAEVVIACVNAETFTPIAIPTIIMSQLTQ